ncbi:SDR family oxidoreductase [Sphingobium sp. HBC34]|uniref:SDR family oxidoreductase n=1 Tax=Sphingobium cyanobacteriorum TaxID=3063954 RepID=A0ABT8ZP80_9SPHN|nr:SDR family oxidoreductase [Sphingobium sp. HBC34]MDO7836344.1 SDR family oxidoreductase [Sphingobium sp. HBC34]
MALTGKRIVVVGGTSGIGLATAHAASAAGAQVTVIGRDPARLSQLAKDNPGWRVACADITDADAIETIFADEARIDHLFISAGTIIIEPATGAMDRLRAPFEERVFGLLHVVRAAMPRFAPDGSFTATTGDLVQRPHPMLAAVAAAAAAVETLCKTFVQEFAPIRFNVVSPGAVDTPLMAGLLGEEGRQAMLADQATKVPIRRIGSADEIAALVLSIMQNGYLNGAVIPIDGGLHAT